MIKRTVEISGYDTHLHMRRDQLIVERDDQIIGQVPMEDVGLLVIDSPTATYSHTSLVKLLGYGAGVVLCDEDHMPAAFLTALDGHHLQAERLRTQVEASKPACKRLWQQIVQAKIKNQAAICESPEGKRRLLVLQGEVGSGDPKNVEAQAARIHWSEWLGPSSSFRRKRDGDPPNALLNYGYMAIRASVARAIVGSGLHPSVGLKHSNRYNAFALADDLLEPLRPLVDLTVRDLHRGGKAEIDKDTKAALLGVLTHTCGYADQTGPLLVALEMMAASLVRCLSGEEKALRIPEIFPTK
jgi:CRISPR-associated protein Cas1